MCSEELQGNQRKYCSGACKQKAHWYSKKEQPNSYHSQTIRALKRKIEYIELLGGGCAHCGYNKNISALEFNHIDPTQKALRLDARTLSNTNEKDLLDEVMKCEILCANCHREHHYKEMELDNVKKILNL